jgi:hypothetical protein
MESVFQSLTRCLSSHYPLVCRTLYGVDRNKPSRGTKATTRPSNSPHLSRAPDDSAGPVLCGRGVDPRAANGASAGRPIQPYDDVHAAANVDGPCVVPSIAAVDVPLARQRRGLYLRDLFLDHGLVQMKARRWTPARVPTDPYRGKHKLPGFPWNRM